MTQPLLSILIPTVVGREEQFDRLTNKIHKLIGEDCIMISGRIEGEFIVKYNEIEIRTLKDNKEMTIGEKREILYNNSKGLYSFMIDDDDDISDNAIQLILEAIKSNPEVDVITFEEFIDIDGKIEKSNHSLSYGDWEGEGGKELWDGFHYHRTPFFKSVIKTEIARSVPIQHIRFSEDHLFAQSLKPHLKTEIHISQQLYRYIHVSSNHNERYGIK